ncbi:MAG: hypothetical protein OEV59_02190 [Deltaproteobacteria bacterium]|nr:hypothetical protein [Deltaproteobacteria bacterium]
MKLKQLKKIFVFVAAIFAVAVFSASCGKKEEAQQPPAQTAAPGQALPEGHPAPGSGAAGAPQTHSGIKTAKPVKIGPEVAAKWKQVELAVTDKTAKKKATLKVKIGGSANLSGGYTLKVNAFAPDWTSYSDYIGTKSNDANNTAVHISLVKGGQVEAEGWIFNVDAFSGFNTFASDKFEVELVAPKAKPTAQPR